MLRFAAQDGRRREWAPVTAADAGGNIEGTGQYRDDNGGKEKRKARHDTTQCLLWLTQAATRKEETPCSRKQRDEEDGTLLEFGESGVSGCRRWQHTAICGEDVTVSIGNKRRSRPLTARRMHGCSAAGAKNVPYVFRNRMCVCVCLSVEMLLYIALWKKKKKYYKIDAVSTDCHCCS